MTLFETALDQFEEASYGVTRLLPGDKRRVEAQKKYDNKRRALLDYVNALEEKK